MSNQLPKLPYTTRKEQHAHMKMRQAQNRVSCLKSKAEEWAHTNLTKLSGLKWKRQAQWGYRLFDFWNSTHGIAIEIDGREHNREEDRLKDEYNFRRSGIVILRVRNNNEDDLEECLSIIKKLVQKGTWQERRINLNCSKKNGILKADKDRSYLSEYIASLQ